MLDNKIFFSSFSTSFRKITWIRSRLIIWTVWWSHIWIAKSQHEASIGQRCSNQGDLGHFGTRLKNHEKLTDQKWIFEHQIHHPAIDYRLKEGVVHQSFREVIEIERSHYKGRAGVELSYLTHFTTTWPKYNNTRGWRLETLSSHLIRSHVNNYISHHCSKCTTLQPTAGSITHKCELCRGQVRHPSPNAP